jgi:hypothetical protein
MIAEITTEGNNPKMFDRHHGGNSHAVTEVVVRMF